MAFEIDKFYFANAKILSMLPARDKKMLEEGVVKRRIKAGKVIYREGSFPKGVYILTKGKVKIYQTTQEARRQIMYIYTAGEIFGFRPIVCDELHPVTAASLEECKYDFIPREHFLKCLNSSTAFSNALFVSLAHEFTVWVNNVTVFAQYPVKSRVALGLLVLREKYRVKGKPTEINLSREDLASYVGTVKESAVRALQDFKQRKMIETQGRKIRILNPQELKALVSFY